MNPLEAVLYLALNIYHEARSEDQFAQLAVAHVTLNRAKIRNLPIKEVVLQPYQFSWTFQKASWLPDDFDAFAECFNTAVVSLSGFDFTAGATHYHHKSIIPEWTNRMVFVASFGEHYFYLEK